MVSELVSQTNPSLHILQQEPRERGPLPTPPAQWYRRSRPLRAAARRAAIQNPHHPAHHQPLRTAVQGTAERGGRAEGGSLSGVRQVHRLQEGRLRQVLFSAHTSFSFL